MQEFEKSGFERREFLWGSWSTLWTGGLSMGLFVSCWRFVKPKKRGLPILPEILLVEN